MRKAVMTASEAGLRLRLTSQQVRALVMRGELEGRQVAGRYSAWWVTRRSVERYRRARGGVDV